VPTQVHVHREARVEDLKQNLLQHCGVPLDLQRLKHRGRELGDDALLLELRGEDPELQLDLDCALDGGGGSVQCGDCQLAIKILCFSASCGGEWKKQQCFCCKMQCSVM